LRSLRRRFMGRKGSQYGSRTSLWAELDRDPASVVGVSGASLVASPPPGAGLDVGWCPGWCDDQVGDQVADLVTGQRDRPIVVGPVVWVGRAWWGCRGGHGEERQGEYGQDGEAVPGGPAAAPVVVEADLALAGLEPLFDAPAEAGDSDQGGQGDRAGDQQR
jgi:hypothetical protein